MSVVKPKQFVIDYWPAWSGQTGAQRLLNEISDKVDVVNISFAYPTKDGNIVWPDYAEDNTNGILKLIEALHKKGKKVLISLGGAGHNDWNFESSAIQKKLAANVKKFVEQYGFDGVDIDCEQGYDSTQGQKSRSKISELIIELRKQLPSKLITYAAWSTGAYGTPNHQHPEWEYENSTRGMEVEILKKAGNQLDWVNVMAYDAFGPGMNYNPIDALNAYKDLMGGRPDKVVLGIHPGPQSWPENYRSPITDITSWVQHASNAGFKGIMFWNLTEDDVLAKSQQKNNTYLNLAHNCLHQMGREIKQMETHLAGPSAQQATVVFSQGVSEQPASSPKMIDIGSFSEAEQAKILEFIQNLKLTTGPKRETPMS